jgi:ribosomal protein S18 acetylase RimI-like enzyme
MIRKATLNDVNGLVEIENISFDTDKISRRNFRYLLTKANAETLVDEERGVIHGYALLLLHSGTSLARLYSIAVHPRYRGNNIGVELLTEIERIAIERDCVYLRLEVRSDNEPARNLYLKFGYKKIGIIPEYYEDRMEATRYEKFLPGKNKPDLALVAYYEQTLDFTCGASALMMAMHAIDPTFPMDRKTELRIWRESTTIFMTSGHGGCGPYGLALAAFKRGFNVDLFISEDPHTFLVDSVRSIEKKEVMRLVQEDFWDQILKLPITVHEGSLSIDEMEEEFTEGGIPIILISSYQIYREKFPHWVVVTGFDDKYIYCHDPFVDYDMEKSPLDCINMPILKKDFEKMARYGKSVQKAALIIKR